MSRYIRSNTRGGTFFFTVVTHLRRPILTDRHCRQALRHAIRTVQAEHPFIIDAWVLLPDHMHCIWTLPTGDRAFSKRWGMIKTRTTQNLNHRDLPLPHKTSSRKAKREGGLWQRRFWEHLIHDERDLWRHLNYLHYNPVKHGLVQHVRDWPFSSFHRYVKQGLYSAEWGGGIQEMNIAGE